MAQREEEHGKLKARVNLYPSETTDEAKLQKIALLLLESNPHDCNPDTYSILEIVRDWLPPAQEYFEKIFYKSPFITFSNLKKVMKHYGVNL